MARRASGFGSLSPAGWACFSVTMFLFLYGFYGFSQSKVGTVAFHLFATTAHAVSQHPRVLVSLHRTLPACACNSLDDGPLPEMPDALLLARLCALTFPTFAVATVSGDGPRRAHQEEKGDRKGFQGSHETSTLGEAPPPLSTLFPPVLPLTASTGSRSPSCL
eukprot:COSAG05_NODE_2734_length_2712_cov_3.694604_3_plen_163_part_00